MWSLPLANQHKALPTVAAIKTACTLSSVEGLSLKAVVLGVVELNLASRLRLELRVGRGLPAQARNQQMTVCKKRPSPEYLEQPVQVSGDRPGLQILASLLASRLGLGSLEHHPLAVQVSMDFVVRCMQCNDRVLHSDIRAQCFRAEHRIPRTAIARLRLRLISLCELRVRAVAFLDFAGVGRGLSAICDMLSKARLRIGVFSPASKVTRHPIPLPAATIAPRGTSFSVSVWWLLCCIMLAKHLPCSTPDRSSLES